ncbi:hypothetical protein [Yinghuangia soli]|uniref:Uncharacterized protein n=1 Tax=Yinghuangia soli TaxID=2908204 RepID=A0AA41TZS3_9ACTN|nr:hypothetical protein [Yinghuangia soli]MCF2525647.1 hypothetical protein [Yinghuangia soli]
MDEKQLQWLKRILDLLQDLSGDMGEAVPFDSVQAQGFRQRIEAVQREIAALVADMDGNKALRMECAVLRAVYQMLFGGVQQVLAAVPAGGKPGTAVLTAQAVKAMVAVCDLEAVSLVDVGKPPVVVAEDDERLLTADKALFMMPCTVKDGRVFVEGEQTSSVRVYGLSRSMLLLRADGIKAVMFDNADGASVAELVWMCSVARKIFRGHGRRFGLVINVPVSVPEAGSTMFLHLTFHKTGMLRMRFESYAIAPKYTSTLTVPETKRRMKEHFKLGDFEEDGAAWSLVELVQLHNALAKLPTADRIVLEGCRFIRKKMSDDPEEAAERGAYRVFQNSITLLDAVFPGDDYGFVGVGGNICPYSHWVVLHEIGHAVELRHWHAQYKKWDTSAIEKELKTLGAREKELNVLLAPDRAMSLAEHKKLTDEKAANHSRQLVLSEQLRTCQIEQIKMNQATIDNKSVSVCLRSFVDFAGKLGIQPFTLYAQNKWASNQGEFFAEAYTLFLNDPDILRWISPDLFQWFADGRYRVWEQQ